MMVTRVGLTVCTHRIRHLMSAAFHLHKYRRAIFNAVNHRVLFTVFFHFDARRKMTPTLKPAAVLRSPQFAAKETITVYRINLLF